MISAIYAGSGCAILDFRVRSQILRCTRNSVVGWRCNKSKSETIGEVPARYEGGRKTTTQCPESTMTGAARRPRGLITPPRVLAYAHPGTDLTLIGDPAFHMLHSKQTRTKDTKQILHRKRGLGCLARSMQIDRLLGHGISHTRQQGSTPPLGVRT